MGRAGETAWGAVRAGVRVRAFRFGDRVMRLTRNLVLPAALRKSLLRVLENARLRRAGVSAHGSRTPPLGQVNLLRNSHTISDTAATNIGRSRTSDARAGASTSADSA